MSAILIIFYVLTFLAIYVQVFLLVTFFERRKDILIRNADITLPTYPTVTIIVPCYNEEDSVKRTVDSLLALHYPADKLSISLVDNMSKDKTWEILKGYESHPQISIFQEPVPGKHNALNCALRQVKTEFVGCLDADSSVHPEALKRILTYFSNPLTMAVAPSIVVRDPKNFLEYAQRAEYDMAHYTKKMLAFLEGIHVTPGPFSIFRKRVFDEIGEYRKAHHTEDQEIALRMHKYGYAIDHCPDAYVYTGGQNTVPKLFRQRVRWIYGFIQNARDYRELIFRPKYGAIGLFTLPSGIISVSATLFLLIFTVSRIYTFIVNKAMKLSAVGFTSASSTNFSFDFFYLDTRAFLFISIILYILVISALFKGRSMIYGRKALSFDILIFVAVYTVIAPFWIVKAIWNAVFSHEASWTDERDYKLT